MTAVDTKGAAAEGRLYVISAPSGAGKTSLVRALLAARPTLALSVSTTTRAPRPNEQDGREYHFVSVPEFERRVAEGAFLEHARVFDNYYGTSRATVMSLREAGKDVLLEIDWQGARQVRRTMADATLIFILPPSRATLEQRLRDRKTDSEAVIARRLADAAGDMSHCPEFHYAVVNEDFATAVAQLGRILDGQGTDLAASRPALGPLLAELTAAPN